MCGRDNRSPTFPKTRSETAHVVSPSPFGGPAATHRREGGGVWSSQVWKWHSSQSVHVTLVHRRVFTLLCAPAPSPRRQTIHATLLPLPCSTSLTLPSALSSISCFRAATSYFYENLESFHEQLRLLITRLALLAINCTVLCNPCLKKHWWSKQCYGTHKALDQDVGLGFWFCHWPKWPWASYLSSLDSSPYSNLEHH